MSAISTTINFEQELSRRVGDTSRFQKFREGLQGVKEEYGTCAKSSVVAMTALSTLGFAGLVGFSGYGSIKLFEKGIVALQNGERVPSDSTGHGGEWSSQLILYCFVFGQEMSRLVGEGEYRRVLSATSEILSDRSIKISEETALPIYQSILKHLEYSGNKTFFHKSPLQDRILAVRAIKEARGDLALVSQNEISVDIRMKEIYETVQDELRGLLSLRQFGHRFSEGLRSVGQRKGCMGQVAALAAGAGLPVILSIQSVLSFIGAYSAADEILNHGEEEFVWGHVGEWPANGIAFLYMAKFFNQWGVLNAGDFVVAKGLYQNKLLEVKGDAPVASRLKELFEEDLLKRASLPMQSYKPSECVLTLDDPRVLEIESQV